MEEQVAERGRTEEESLTSKARAGGPWGRRTWGFRAVSSCTDQGCGDFPDPSPSPFPSPLLSTPLGHKPQNTGAVLLAVDGYRSVAWTLGGWD